MSSETPEKLTETPDTGKSAREVPEKDIQAIKTALGVLILVLTGKSISVDLIKLMADLGLNFKEESVVLPPTRIALANR